jgi:hypothetical protein
MSAPRKDSRGGWSGGPPAKDGRSNWRLALLAVALGLVAVGVSALVML